ncbi:MAG: site-2 protease family protein [Acidimicrobiia bacterium]|nr:site-2 protease family protein [Acidimicrobiia bacterium]
MTTGVEPATNRRGSWTSFPIARVAGIEVRVHLSFLVLVALFAAAAPEPGVANALLSVTWLLVIFACVIVHEFAHSLVARTRGVDVHEILLLPLGGVSKMERLPERPRDEFAIAIVGPLASFAIAAMAGALCIVTGHSLVPVDLIDGAWLARITWLNLILGAFNLIPAFPLDGGRVFRSLLERNQTLEAATRTATRVGHAFAVALMVIGFFFDLWLMLIGAFIYFGASAEQAATIVHIRLEGHHVADAMRVDLDRIPIGPWMQAAPIAPEDPLSDELIARLARAVDRQLPVAKAGQVTGVLRLEDVDRLIATS